MARHFGAPAHVQELSPGSIFASLRGRGRGSTGFSNTPPKPTNPLNNPEVINQKYDYLAGNIPGNDYKTTIDNILKSTNSKSQFYSQIQKEDLNVQNAMEKADRQTQIINFQNQVTQGKATDQDAVAFYGKIYDDAVNHGDQESAAKAQDSLIKSRDSILKNDFSGFLADNLKNGTPMSTLYTGLAGLQQRADALGDNTLSLTITTHLNNLQKDMEKGISTYGGPSSATVEASAKKQYNEFSKQVDSTIQTAMAYHDTGQPMKNPAFSNDDLAGPAGSLGAPDWLRPIIDQASQATGVPAKVIEAVVKQESGFNPHAVGDNGDSHGLRQYNSPSHPNLTLEQMQDPTFSINSLANDLKSAFRGDWAQAAVDAQRPANLHNSYYNSIGSMIGSVNTKLTSVQVDQLKMYYNGQKNDYLNKLNAATGMDITSQTDKLEAEKTKAIAHAESFGFIWDETTGKFNYDPAAAKYADVVGPRGEIQTTALNDAVKKNLVPLENGLFAKQQIMGTSIKYVPQLQRFMAFNPLTQDTQYLLPSQVKDFVQNLQAEGVFKNLSIQSGTTDYTKQGIDSLLQQIQSGAINGASITLSSDRPFVNYAVPGSDGKDHQVVFFQGNDGAWYTSDQKQAYSTPSHDNAMTAYQKSLIAPPPTPAQPQVAPAQVHTNNNPMAGVTGALGNVANAIFRPTQPSPTTVITPQSQVDTAHSLNFNRAPAPINLPPSMPKINLPAPDLSLPATPHLTNFNPPPQQQPIIPSDQLNLPSHVDFSHLADFSPGLNPGSSGTSNTFQSNPQPSFDLGGAFKNLSNSVGNFFSGFHF